MGTKRFRKLLDAWDPPENSGDPVGCLATSYTFDAAFFEEECLSRFLQLECNKNNDDPFYVVEREEKLAKIKCAAALVDQHKIRGENRSLRWDLLSAKIRGGGIQHSKVSLLVWSKVIRVVIGSANLTEPGYRRNREVFGQVDFRSGGEAPLSLLRDTISFLRRAGGYSEAKGGGQSPALGRWNGLLKEAAKKGKRWGLTDEEVRRHRPDVRVQALFSGRQYPDVFHALGEIWPGNYPPVCAAALSPFFDPPEVKPNKPAQRLWGMVRKRGEAYVEFHVDGREEGSITKLYAPRALMAAKPVGRPKAKTLIKLVAIEKERPFHAKGLWLHDDRWSVYAVGSSNFTSAGMGVGRASNLEANIVYIGDNVPEELDKAWPVWEEIDPEGDDVHWEPIVEEGEDLPGPNEVRLPAEFGDATYKREDKGGASIVLSIFGEPPPGWELHLSAGEFSDQDRLFFSEVHWKALGGAEEIELPWKKNRPPSGFTVCWKGCKGDAWLPVNALDGSVLQPPEGLRNLSLEELLDILGSSRPLHRVLRSYRPKQEHEGAGVGHSEIIDPHQRVDTSRFLLQRTRRISHAFIALRERLERPAILEVLERRLTGPVGVSALADAMEDEFRSAGNGSEAEVAFFLCELALELSRVQPLHEEGCLPRRKHKEKIRETIFSLLGRIKPGSIKGPANMRRYIESVVREVKS